VDYRELLKKFAEVDEGEARAIAESLIDGAYWVREGIEVGDITNGVRLYLAARKLIDKIVRRDGIGDLLAEGLAVACRRVDDETCKWAVQARGLEHSRVETRIARAYALVFALNPRGPDHLHTETFAEFGFTEDSKKLIERITGHREWAGVGKNEGRPEIVAWHEEMYAVTDSVGFCAFITTRASL
ncbi:MAG: hypothetical protein J7L51_04175, partial [Desulfurococcales archaeon]|nr:hypothetical protein [Desulfurococcales archaeon]